MKTRCPFFLVLFILCLGLYGQEVSKEMLDFPLKQKEVEKMTSKLRKLNARLEEKLADLRDEINETESSSIPSIDNTIVDQVRAKKDSLQQRIANLEAGADSLGLTELMQNQEYQALKEQVETLELSALSENELLTTGLDSLTNQLEFLMGQKDAIEFNKSLGELKQELNILRSQEEAISIFKDRVDFDQFEDLQSEFEVLQSLMTDAQGTGSAYQERLRNWDKELETFIMEHPTIKAMQDEFSQQKNMEQLFNDRSKGMRDLQSKELVKEQVMEQVGGSEQQVSQMLGEKIAEANTELASFKNKLDQLSDFPEINEEASNPLKGVPLKYRLVYSGNMNVNRGDPASLDINFNFAYRLYPKWSLGAGVNYRSNLGSDIDDIEIYMLGWGARSFIDFNITYNWFLEGAYEYFYGEKDGSLSKSNSDLNFKQKYETALVGLGYRYRISGKIKGKVMAFYDLLINQNSPYNNPLQFRVGFEF